MSIGRRLERAMYSARELREIATPLGEQEWALLECLLEVADSSITYRSRYYTTLQPLAVLDVLMADGCNPRSLDFQLSHLIELYQKLPRHSPEDLQAMQDALELLRSFDLQTIDYPLPGGQPNTSGRQPTTPGGHPNGPSGPPRRSLRELERCLRELEQLLPSWSNNLSSRYFSHARTLPITIG
jgi:hypothetical protein